MDRKTLIAWAKKTYNTAPESLWAKSPDNVIMRHSNNRKWHAVILPVSRSKLGIGDDEIVDVLDVKADPMMIGSLLQIDGILPGYHMNKNSWISLLLDGTVSDEQIKYCLDVSYELTDNKLLKKSK